MRLGGDGLDARVGQLTDVLRDDGELTVRTTMGGTSPALIDFRIRAPGGMAGHDMSFRYAELYETRGSDWLLVEYVYLMASRAGLGQREYHWHPVHGGSECVFHAHCTGLGSSRRGHFRSHRILLEEARAEFLRRYAAGEHVDCTDLYPYSEPKT